MAELFCQTVFAVNTKDYTNEQLHAWTDHLDLEKWNQSFLKNHTIIAIEDDQLVGFGDLDFTGYLDHLYVHKNYQHQGIASAICDYLEQLYDGKTITTHASITAQPFFKQRGYKTVKKQHVIRNGIVLENYVMQKQFNQSDAI